MNIKWHVNKEEVILITNEQGADVEIVSTKNPFKTSVDNSHLMQNCYRKLTSRLKEKKH